MKTFSANDIATWFILKFAEYGDVVTHLKIQKLLYFSEAWNQVINDSELFKEEIQAWAHGPVVLEVFQQYKDYGWKPLPIPNDQDCPKFPAKVLNILLQVFDSYGELPAKTLENMTHTDRPWIDARGDLAPEERCNTVIPKDQIKSYFKTKYGM
ncbi:DUF4065 domain-containing protein [Kosakonia cowanii]|uniref:Panacea domain-containing protein n=1 Tax=Kosakonia cowanii TaxID=208223 RepID=UPI000FECC5CB|nr:type II toxin-antitoxin system antitoxin SocA domain-containing protein [Kosakonia cowanii]QAR44316.1 DUF4065 domain-containing protein [Kosakonia cowanii]